MVVWVVGVFLLSFWVASALGIQFPLALTVGSLGLATLVAYAGRRARSRLWSAPLVLAAAFLGGGLASPPMANPVSEGLARIEARVERVTARGAFVRVERGSHVGAPGRLTEGARLFVRGLDQATSSRIRMLVTLQPLVDFHNHSPHGEWQQTSLDGFARLRGEPDVLDQSRLAERLHTARRSLRNRLEQTLSPQAAGFARALLLGEGGATLPEDREVFRRAGIAHLLAVSGLHVGLVVAGLLLLFRRLLTGRCADPIRQSALYVIPLTLGFAMMAGGAPSAWRACLSAVIALLCRVARRRPRAAPLMAAAVGLFAVFSPRDLARPGFLLSVAATAAIVSADFRPSSEFLGDEWSSQPSLWERFRTSGLGIAILVSLRTTLATLPLVLWCFDGLPILGVIANVFIVPLAVFVMVPWAFLHALASGVGLEILTAGPFELICGAVSAFSESFAWSWTPPPLSNAQGIILGLCSGGLLWAKSWRRGLFVVLLALVCFSAAEFHLRHSETPSGHLRVTFADVGQGDGAIVDMPDGSLVLVDVAGGRPDAGEESILPLLRARRRDHVALAIISHPHPDHYGGFAALAGNIPIDEVWASGQAMAEIPHGPAAALIRRLRQHGSEIRLPASFCGETRRFGEAELEVLWPCPAFDEGYEANDNSIVVRLRFRGRSILFTGDIEHGAEQELSGSRSLRSMLHAEILKVPHHGSRTSSSDAFLDHVQPRFAIASAGRQNRFGHPHSSVVARYRRRGIPFWRTSEGGGVVAETDGTAWLIRNAAGRTLRLLNVASIEE